MCTARQIAGVPLVAPPAPHHRRTLRPFTVASAAQRRAANQQPAVAAQAAAPQLDRRALLAAGAACATAAASAAFAADSFQTAPNGLSWKDTKEGEGPAPASGATIRCNYTGKLVSNGKVFDSSYGRRPLSFKIGVRQVIAGWDIGILGDEQNGIPPMKEGGKRTLRIPAALGYGARGAGGVIPPNSDLEFDVELLAKRPGF